MNRDHHTIIYDLLKPAEKAPQGKTALMYKAIVSSNQLHTYLNILLTSKLLSYDEESRKYSITGLGLQFLHQYEELTKLVDFTKIPY